MKLFSKQRKAALPGSQEKPSGRFQKYVLYALGEIILVVIGILIAVAINNRNEARQDGDRLTTYLKNYRTDLTIDTTMIGYNLRILDKKKEGFDLVLSDTLTKENLIKTPVAFALMLTYNPIQLQSKGYAQLQSHVDNPETVGDSLVMNIVAKHAAYDALLKSSIQRISDDIDDNMAYLKNNEPWVADLLTGKMNDEILTYFTSKDYKNRVAIHQTLVYQNLAAFLEQYLLYAKETLTALDERLAEE
ncbi:MAG: hypothetical protein CMC74_03330 [Flavobacteriaceae bacterium]|nr:hypothetical protein [Flavobacteriaceae bacterium]|tara:strand:- start:12211 stop:12951 length:741 start_codon:yes stop_codon:yes gene_type:complete